MRFRYLNSLLLILLTISPVLHAQDKNSVSSNFKDKFRKVGSSFRDSMQQVTYDLNEVEYELEKAKLEYDIARHKYFKRQYDVYYTQSLKHRSDSFSWQYSSSKIIFWFVILIMLSGLFFASVQFYISYKAMKSAANRLGKKKENESPNPNVPVQDEIEVSLSGIKVKSSVLGVIILVISIAFFYLYLVYVYPIKPVNL